jgi:hypothetical protein
MFIKDTKGGKNRMVHLPRPLADLLCKYMDEYNPDVWFFEGQFSQGIGKGKAAFRCRRSFSLA